MNANPYDVLVVGGGPAGSTAARLLARRGYRVGLLEKEHMPRYKACAGGLCLRHPERFDLDLTPVILGWTERFILTYEGRKRRSVELPLPKGDLAMIDRVRFDGYLWEQARAAGAEAHSDTVVRQVELVPEGVLLSTSRGQFQGRYLIGADGADSLINRRLGIQPQTPQTLSLVIDVDSEHGAPVSANEIVISLGCVRRGYGWIFPKLKSVSLGIFTVRSGSRDLRPWLKRYLKLWGLEADRLPTAIHGAWQRPGRGRGPWHKGRVALVGDAGALNDPLSGEGISHALHSAALAAQSIDEALQKGLDDLSTYSKRVTEEIAGDFSHAWHLARAFYWLPRMSFSFIAHNPDFGQRFLDTIPGRLTYAEFNRLLRKKVFLGGLGR